MKEINRRNFLGGIGFCAAGALGCESMPGYRKNVKNTKILELSKLKEICNPCDVKINVKPVYAGMIHTYIAEGACREKPNPRPSEEKVQNKNRFNRFINKLKSKLSKDAKMLEPAYIEYAEKTGFGEKQFRILEADKGEVDLYLPAGSRYVQYHGSQIGMRYRKPVARIGSLTPTDMAACLRSRGLEGYALNDFDELNNLISILRARKAFQQTNILNITDRGGKIGRPVMSNVFDLKDLKNRLGIDTVIVTYKKLLDEMNKIKQSADAMKKVENSSDKLIRGAQKVHIDRKYIVSHMIFHFAVKNLMKRYNCNAFAFECFEACSARLSDDWKFVPCLTHTLLKDEGYPSACEGDLNALLAMNILMGISRKSAYMGNLGMVDKDVIYIFHDVPGMKMCGFDKPDLPYELRNFVQSGWGVQAKVDFAKIKEKKVTIARFNPLANKIMVAKGEVIGCEGFSKPGCTLKAIIRVPNAKGLCKKRSDYGYHFAMVYGDYTQELDQLAEMINVEVEFHS